MLSIYVILLTLGLILIVPIFRFLNQHYKNRRILGRIPAPPAKFFFGHLHFLMADLDTLFTQLRDLCATYQPIFRMSTFYVNIVHFLEPNDIELILSTTKHMSKSKIYTFLHNWLGTGLLTSTGEKWHKRRKILTPTFHFSILQQFLNIFNDETTKLVKKLEEECGNEIDVIPSITHFTLQSIAETAMGLSNIDEDVQKKYKQAIYQIGQIFLRRLSKPWLRINAIYKRSKLGKEENETVKILHDFSNSIIAEREKETATVITSDKVASYSKKKRLAMLDLLLAAKNNGADIDYEGIREEVDTFMFEGHDTTSMAISFILLVLANQQDIQAKVLDEILKIVGPSKTPTYTELQELRYTERYASEEFKTRTGYTIPEGTVLHIHIFDLHRNAEIYPDPLKFDPDRFLPENANTRHPFAYIPFSAGPRNCIGQRFAMLELKTVLCGILRKFCIEKVTDMHDIKFRPDLVLRPMTNIKIKILRRHNSDSVK